MRLICPNCGAQYEVADDMIPEGGRDVQCSNCGHTWFEKPGASIEEEFGAPDGAADERPDPAPAPEPEPVPEPEPEPEPEFEPEPEPEPDSEPEPSADRPEEPQRQELDPEVADILRQEAEFEQAARQAEGGGLETQPDLGLTEDPDEDRRSREARDRLARLRGEETAAATAAVGAAAATVAATADTPRRELLPDIEEINSTLRSDTGATDPAAEDTPAKRSGFRRGFILMVVLALIAVALYVFAPQIMAAVPQTEPVLTPYVDWVDGLRIWIDGQVQSLVDQASSGSSDAPAAETEDTQ